MLVQASTTLIAHESFHHVSWSDINFGGSMTDAGNFFTVGSTESLAFQDSATMERSKKFGFISRVDTSSSCLANSSQAEIDVTVIDLVLT